MKPKIPLPAFLHKSRAWAAIGLAGLALATSAHAQTTWTGATSDAYGTGTNWSTGTVPTSGTAVIVDSSATNPTSVTGNWDRAPAGGGGSTTVTGNAFVNVPSGRFFSNGLFTMSGGEFTQTGEYFIAGHLGVGTFNHSAGSVTTTLLRGFFLSNNNANESGTTYNLSGGTLVVNSNSTSGVQEDLRGVYFGKGSAGAGTLVGDLFHATAGTATFTHVNATPSNVRIARNAKLQVSGGTVTFDKYDNFWVGAAAAGTTGSAVIVDGGTLNITGTTNLYIGREDDGQLTINSGTLNLEGFLFIGGDGTGALDGIGTVTMTGGSLFAAGILATDVTGSSLFHFSGGTITLAGDQTGIVNEDWFVGTAFANFDAGSNTTTISAVPEPATICLVVAGLVGALVFRRRLGC